MTNVFLLGAKYAEEGQDIDKGVLQEMWDIRSADFAECGISENNFVYKICEDSFRASQNGRALVNDEASHHALRSMADIGLFLNNQKARGEKVELKPGLGTRDTMGSYMHQASAQREKIV